VALLLGLSGRWNELREILGSGRRIACVVGAACMLGANWYTFIYAVNTGHVMDCSLGYYINPLLNVLLGFVFLGERFRARQAAAVLFAVAGVLNLAFYYGSLPLIALVLAGTFGFYGLLRKTARYEAVPGLLLEMLLLAPAALWYLLGRGGQSLERAFGQGLLRALLICGTGVVTAVPLLLFTYGARRIRLATVGFIQYVTPTGMFLLGVFAYHERFSLAQAVTFVLIWIGVGLYLWDTVQDRSVRPPPP